MKWFLFRRSRRTLLLAGVLSFFIGALLVAPAARAFWPAGHMVIMERVLSALPSATPVAIAAARNPGIAAWGANGPDIPYAQHPSAPDYGLWAYRFHAERAWELAEVQLSRALESEDEQQIAWAAGWVVHLVADEAADEVLIAPEQVTGQREANLQAHRELEAWAEHYVWSDIGGHAPQDLSPRILPLLLLPQPGENVRRLLRESAEQVFGASPTDEEVAAWLGLYSLGLSIGIGYAYTGPEEPSVHLAEGDRRQRIEQAVADARERAVRLLTEHGSGAS